jgi:hypothetical protein
MTCPRANSGQAAKRPTPATPGASLPLDASVFSIVSDLEGHDLNGLRRQWRAHLGGEPPAHLPRWLLIANSDLSRPGIPIPFRPAFRFEAGHHSEMKPAT